MHQQAVILAFNHPVALTAKLFQTLAVEHRNVPAAISDKSDGLQPASSVCHALPAHAEKVRYQFVRHHKIVALRTIKAHQQPSA